MDIRYYEVPAFINHLTRVYGKQQQLKIMDRFWTYHQIVLAGRLVTLREGEKDGRRAECIVVTPLAPKDKDMTLVLR